MFPHYIKVVSTFSPLLSTLRTQDNVTGWNVTQAVSVNMTPTDRMTVCKDLHYNADAKAYATTASVLLEQGDGERRVWQNTEWTSGPPSRREDIINEMSSAPGRWNFKR